jgi:ribonuclease R
VLLRSQSMAVYSIENKGHFRPRAGSLRALHLADPPLPDLLLHRSIKHALLKGNADGFRYTPEEMAALCLQCSEKERRADEAQREVDERYRSAWMEQHVGSSSTAWSAASPASACSSSSTTPRSTAWCT